ncbi:MFS transporter [Brachybacterium sp. JB7]|uniref:MFS transporter n=1 Tax=Brachybacterium TaxID=43668 RepID=UPI000DF20FCD|nr:MULTISPECIES: MFS transporter [Brachybacterium]RCS66177.1 MFS transporter [Brachybacterium sp. JB7]RCS82408.1 MFS transporter [Brachybacterium alimentarium]
MPIPLRRRRWALYALFLLPGLSMSAWVTRTPIVRDLLDASTAQMGLVLFGLSVGSMIGILSSGPLVMRLGTRPVVLAGSTLIVIALPVISLGAVAGMPLLTAFGLALFGAGMGGGEVAMNVEGAEVERLGGRPFLPALHGCFSLGTVIGAGLGILANAGGFPVLPHLVLTSAIGAVLLVWAMRSIPSGVGLISAEERAEQTATPRPAIWKDTRLVLIGGIVLAMALAEGTANDWLPLIMVDGHGFGATMGSTVFALFAASMTVGRFAGGPIVARVGRSRVLMVSALFAAAGLVLIAFVDSQAVAVAAVVLWGLGASLGFPLALSAAGDSGANPAARVALASTIGYLAFLVGPPTLGFLGEHVGLRHALVVPLAVVLVAALLAPSTAPRIVADEELARTR